MTIEGTMEITEFDHERRMAGVTREGGAEYPAWIEKGQHAGR
jgi:hypothetical protein